MRPGMYCCTDLQAESSGETILLRIYRENVQIDLWAGQRVSLISLLTA